MMRFLIVCMLVGILNTTMLAYSGGTGEPNDPYQIATAEDLIALGSEPNDYNDCFILTADIDLSGYSFDQAVIAPVVYNIRGNDFEGIPFNGSLNGQGHVITHLQISGQDCLGLFGGCTPNVTISNVGLEAVDVNGFSGYAGSLVGYNKGIVVSSYSMGSVCGYYCVGGLVGSNEGIIISSYSMGSVSGDRYCVCYVGGLVGNNSGTIASSYSTGFVSGDDYVGGLVGLNSGAITSSFWDTQTSGLNTSDDGTGLMTDQMQTIQAYIDAGWDMVGETTNGTCNFWVIQEGAYPCLSIFSGIIPAEPNGAGTLNDPYQLTDANELGSVWYRPDACYRLDSDIDLSGVFWNSAAIFKFDGIFDGNNHVISNLSIEGGGYLGLFGICGSGATISNVGLEAADVNGTWRWVGGLVGYNQGTITSSYNTGSVSAISNDSRKYVKAVGGLVGYNEGAITLSYSTGSVGGNNRVGGLVGENYGPIMSSYSTGLVNGSSRVGGLVGYNDRDVITSSYSTGSVDGKHYVGGLVGYDSGGSITSSHSTGSVSGDSCVGGLVGRKLGTITSSYSTGLVSGTGDYVGGLVGLNSRAITSSYSTGSVSGVGDSVGGLVGYNSGNITSSYSTGLVCGMGDYVGGLVGYNEGTLTSSCSAGSVNGMGKVGGLVGYNQGTLTSSYSIGSVCGDEEVGGLVGYVYSGHITLSYSTGAVSGTDCIGGLVGYNRRGSIISSLWDIETSGLGGSCGGIGLTTDEMMNPQMVGLNGLAVDPNWVLNPGQDYPHLAWEGTVGESIPTPKMDWINGSGTLDEPYRIASVDQLIIVSKASILMDQCFELEDSLDLSGLHLSQALIPYFKGRFDGQGHIIRNLTIEGQSHLGFFGVLASNAMVLNLGLEAVDVNGTGRYVGGLAGISSGSITSSYSTGFVSGDRNVGGFVGRNDQGSITSSYSTGFVSGDRNVGGFVGSNSGSITSSFWGLETSGQSTSAGGTGLATAQMQDINAFLDAGWDFVDETDNGTDDIWWMPVSDYPRLWWEE